MADRFTPYDPELDSQERRLEDRETARSGLYTGAPEVTDLTDPNFQDRLSQVSSSLANAGANISAIQEYLMYDPGIVDLIYNFPQLATAWAQRFPSGRANEYGRLMTEYGFAQMQDEAAIARMTEGRTTSELAHRGMGAAETAAEVGPIRYNDMGFVEGNNGAIRYKNGVIAVTDPQSGESSVVYPNHNQAHIEGSPVWLEKVRNKWTDKEAQKWRDKLSKLGYSVVEKGGMADDLIQALRTYHKNRYINKGQNIPVAPTEVERIGARDLIGPAAVRGMVREQFRRTVRDDPSDKELDDWSDFVYATARQLLAKGKEPAMAMEEARATFYEAQESDPKVEYLMESEEENTRVRDGLLLTSQVFHRMAGQ